MADLVDFLRTFVAQRDASKSKGRLTSLYSDFSRLKTANPDGYAANIATWISALTEASKCGLLQDNDCAAGLLSLRLGPTLESKLEDASIGRPAALGAVADEAVAQRKLIPLNEYITAKTSVIANRSWTQLELPTAMQVAQWGLRQIGLTGAGSHKLADAEYVIIANLEAVSKTLLSQLSLNPPSAPTSKIHSLETFTNEFSSILSLSQNHSVTPSDINLLLKYLSRDKKIISVSTSPSSPSQTTIKLPSSSTTTAEPITLHDHSIAQLRTLHEALKAQTDHLQTRVQTLSQTARAAVTSSREKGSAANTLSSQDKSRALTALRQKQLATATLDKRQASLAQIDQVLSSIDEAASQVEIVSALQSSTDVIRSLNKQVGGAERVESVMDALHESMADVEDVSKIIAEGGANGVDEGEVDDEFEALEKEEAERRKEDEVQQNETHLPDVPIGQVSENASRIEGKENVSKQACREEETEKRLSQMSLEEDGSKNQTIDSRITEHAAE